MDREIRGLISEAIERVFNQQNILDTAKWATDADDEIQSIEDFALGYVVGALTNIAHNLLVDDKLRAKNKEIKHRILIKDMGKEEAMKFEAELDKNAKAFKAKGGRKVKFETTDEEDNEIRQMITPMIAQFRIKLNQELALR